MAIDPTDKLILALDQMSESEILSLIEKLPNLIWVKVGLELFTLRGPEIICKTIVVLESNSPLDNFSKLTPEIINRQQVSLIAAHALCLLQNRPWYPP